MEPVSAIVLEVLSSCPRPPLANLLACKYGRGGDTITSRPATSSSSKAGSRGNEETPRLDPALALPSSFRRRRQRTGTVCGKAVPAALFVIQISLFVFFPRSTGACSCGKRRALPEMRSFERNRITKGIQTALVDLEGAISWYLPVLSVNPRRIGSSGPLVMKTPRRTRPSRQHWLRSAGRRRRETYVSPACQAAPSSLSLSASKQSANRFLACLLSAQRQPYG